MTQIDDDAIAERNRLRLLSIVRSRRRQKIRRYSRLIGPILYTLISAYLGFVFTTFSTCETQREQLNRTLARSIDESLLRRQQLNSLAQDDNLNADDVLYAANPDDVYFYHDFKGISLQELSQSIKDILQAWEFISTEPKSDSVFARIVNKASAWSDGITRPDNVRLDNLALFYAPYTVSAHPSWDFLMTGARQLNRGQQMSGVSFDSTKQSVSLQLEPKGQAKKDKLNVVAGLKGLAPLLYSTNEPALKDLREFARFPGIIPRGACVSKSAWPFGPIWTLFVLLALSTCCYLFVRYYPYLNNEDIEITEEPTKS